MEAVQTENSSFPSVASPPIPWVSLAWFSVILLISYVAVIRHLAYQWSVDEDVSHGFFVPLVAGYVAWQRRAELFAAEWKPNYLGAAAVAWPHEATER